MSESKFEEIISKGTEADISIDEILEILNEVADTAFANYSDDGKLDSKELVLLLKMVVALTLQASDDPKLKSILKIVKQILGVAAFFTDGTDLE